MYIVVREKKNKREKRKRREERKRGVRRLTKDVKHIPQPFSESSV